jgi:hypothetical protein
MASVIADAAKRNPDVSKTLVGFATNIANYSPIDSKGLPPATEGGTLQSNNGQLVYQGIELLNDIPLQK